MDLGPCVLGDELEITLQCVTPSTKVATVPDAAPTIKVYTEAGTLVVSKTLPPIDKQNVTGLFGIMLPLNSSFSTGRHVVRKEFVVSATTYVDEELDFFEIKAGGHSGGQIVSMAFIDRPEQNSDWIVSQTDMGQIGLLRGPQI